MILTSNPVSSSPKTDSPSWLSEKPDSRPFQTPSGRWKAHGAVLIVLAALIGWWGYEHFSHPHRHFNPKDYPLSLTLANPRWTLIPESERPLDKVVLGISRVSDSYFLLPKLENRPGLDPKRLELVRKMFYCLDLEMSHGQIWNLFPSDSILYIGVPVRSDTGKHSSLEREWFNEYLQTRWGWTKDQVRHRIRFFDTPEVVIWGQDIGEILGRTPDDKIILALGKGEPKWYRESVLNLVKDYPDDFTLWETSPPVSTEGGDLELVWGANGQPLILAGRFAAIRYYQRSRGNFPATQRVGAGELTEAQFAFRNDFFGLPVAFLPRAALLDPSRGDPELFHLDMIAALFAGPNHARAFVPSLEKNSVDALSGKPLDRAFRGRLQGEFDEAALELEAKGYEVFRLPFADHPVRSPANLLKYFDRATGRQVVMLSKYPNHIGPPGVPTAESQILDSLKNLNNWLFSWESLPSDQTYSGLMWAFRSTWGNMNQAASSENPFFDQQKALFEKCGYQVIPVPMFPWGAGGLHCLTLH